MSNFLEVKNLTKHFPIHGGILFKELAKVYALNGVSFKVNQGETIGVVGESGCGKSTLGKTLLNLYSPTDGSVEFNGKKIYELDKNEMMLARREFQMIFQDPYESLNPKHTVRKILSEPFKIHKIGNSESILEEIKKLLNRVGLPESALSKYPHEFSGGQRQRIGIARAIALKPKLIVCDEAVSALDVSVQSQVLNLLMDLQKEMNLTYIFIAHDLSVVKHISDRIMVMYLGNIVELANAEDIYKRSLHPYTQTLINSIPIPDPSKRIEDIEVIEGEIPSPRNPPSGCAFHTRCPFANDKCRSESPSLSESHIDSNHLIACHHEEDIFNKQK